MHVGQLAPVPLSEVWLHEAHNFTKWLADNLDYLSERLGTELSLVDSEVAAGTFSADIVCEDQNGNSVLIENQLERTDHDHLGKLLTYMSNLDVKTAIWITSDPRPEHEKAVNWLDEALPADTAFYLVKIEAFRIDDSAPAPLFSVVAGPSEEGREVGKKKKELAARHLQREKFWTERLDKAKAKTSLHSRISPSRDHWISAGAGRSGLAYNYVILKDSARVELYIDTGDAEENERIFDALFHQREAIEQAFGDPLEWGRLDERGACRIHHPIEVGGLRDEAQWPQIQGAMIDAMVQLHAAFGPALSRL